MSKQFEQYVTQGFEGFVPVKDMISKIKEVKACKGVYMILRPNDDAPEFLHIGSGGHFKDKDPNVNINVLMENWIDDTDILYIGKATSLQKRLDQYMRFGQGQKIGHWGGRYIWQLKNAQNLIVCWKPTKDDSRLVEHELIQNFKQNHNGKRPFANLVD